MERYRWRTQSIGSPLKTTCSSASDFFFRDPCSAPSPATSRRSFWWTAFWLYGLWNLGTVFGHIGASQVGDPAALGLDAAFPAAFLAMLIPLLRTRRLILVAVAGTAIAVLTVPLLPAGIPILLAALGIFAGRGMTK